MSFTELHNGKLTPIKEDPEEFAKEYFEKHNIEYDSDYKSYVEQLIDECYEEYILINNTLYKMNDENLGESEVNWHRKNSDGSIEYCVQFYNGGCSLYEALKNELEDKK